MRTEKWHQILLQRQQHPKWVVTYAVSQERLAGLYEGEQESYEQLSERLAKWVFEGFRIQAKTRFHSDFRDIFLKKVIRREEFLAIHLAFDCAGEPSEDYLPVFDFFEVVELKPLDLA